LATNFNLSTIWAVGARKASVLLKSHGFSDEELDLSSFVDGDLSITILKPFGEKLQDIMIDEEEDSDETLELLENFTVSDGKYLKNLFKSIE
jgi:hypothetical protein